MAALEKRMQKGTWMAKIAASSCLMTREENEVQEKEIIGKGERLKLQNELIEKEQVGVEALYDELQEISAQLQAANVKGTEVSVIQCFPFFLVFFLVFFFLACGWFELACFGPSLNNTSTTLELRPIRFSDSPFFVFF